MGSALGGIYAPILSALTLYVVYRQLRLQAVIHIEQVEWQKRQISYQHGLYLCEKIKENMSTPEKYNEFLSTLKKTEIEAYISKTEYLELVSEDDTSMLLYQVITLLRKLRHDETDRDILFHLKGLVLTSIEANNLRKYEMNLCRWHNIYIKGFNKELCVFIDESDLEYLFRYKNEH
ncbi:hypothetical protein [Pectobacterium polaris]|uniref:hypothetical protein n=1 Tax=Pectobacterium polaris TaxID=2042057 RepID=UPI000F8EE615|nr:hypothetical protein [Pectobacterium polaris]